MLFTDIVGSTERAAELGDRAWRNLLERHHAAVRRELKAFQGREMDTAGDGFFAVFEAPERAVRCAESITRAVSVLGVEVRAGLHTGECELIGGKAGGMAVVIGARISALAGPGQVLVSSSVRELMTGSGVRFEGGEPQDLKGVTEPWRVYRLVRDDGVGTNGVSRRPSMVPLYTRRHWWRLAGALTVVVAVLLAGSLVYVQTRPEAVVVVGEDAVGMIEPGSEVRVKAAVDVGRRPTSVAAGFGSIWVTNSTDGTVSRIDRRTGSMAPISLGASSSPSGVAVGAGAVWVADSGSANVSRIDPQTSAVTAIPVGAGPTGIVAAFGSVWVANTLDASVTEIDPATNKVRHEVPVGASPTGIAAGGGFIWVTNQGDGTVTRFAPDTHEKDPAITVGHGPTGIAVTSAAAWVTNGLDGSISRIDVGDLTVTALSLVKDGGAYGVAAHGDDVWVSNQFDRTVMRLTTTGEPRVAETLPVRGVPLGLVFAGADLWFTSAAGGAVHRGGVLTMVGSSVIAFDDHPAVLDPADAADELAYRLFAMTNDGLLGLRRSGGTAGTDLVPDLATSRPVATNGGLTYTFHLHKEVRYDTGAKVLAGDVRRGIERTILRGSSFAKPYVDALSLTPACRKQVHRTADSERAPRPTDCDVSTAIVADDQTGTITFHLRRPTPEFLYLLALPPAFAVPQQTPLDLVPGSFVPATGPYKVRTYVPNQVDGRGRTTRHGRLELVRNPAFSVWSPAAQPGGNPDRIVLETGYPESESVARVRAGRSDVVWAFHPPLEIGELGPRYARQVHTGPGSWIRYLFLNTTKPPFDNLDARRAVAYGLDRAAMAGGGDWLSGPVTCQLIPPNFAGYRLYCPFTVGSTVDARWTGQDFATAEDLVERSRTRGARVTVIANDDPAFVRVAEQVGDLLERLGYRASVIRPTNPGVIFDPQNAWNVGFINISSDYPSAQGYAGVLGACPPDNPDATTPDAFNLSALCDPAIEKQIQAARVQQVTEPGGANDAWAAVDRAVVDAAATIPYGNSFRQDFVSSRVRNVLVNPQIGLLVDQIWVQ